MRAIDISTSALVAQRVRLDTISGNIANMSSLVNEEGKAEPYRARSTVFRTDDTIKTSTGASGVRVEEVVIDDRDPLYRYQPDHPLAAQDGEWKGYVAYPNIDLTTQMVDALEATRAYEANVGVMEISKALGRETLSIIA
ncbi:flagellar basal body rod protein FlgC [Planctomycetaceae bacterium SH139]